MLREARQTVEDASDNWDRTSPETIPWVDNECKSAADAQASLLVGRRRMARGAAAALQLAVVKERQVDWEEPFLKNHEGPRGFGLTSEPHALRLMLVPRTFRLKNPSVTLESQSGDKAQRCVALSLEAPAARPLTCAARKVAGAAATSAAKDCGKFRPPSGPAGPLKIIFHFRTGEVLLLALSLCGHWQLSFF